MSTQQYLEYLTDNLPNSTVTFIGSAALGIAGEDDLDFLVEVDDVRKAADVLAATGSSQGAISEKEAWLHDRRYGSLADIRIVHAGGGIARQAKAIHRLLTENAEIRDGYEAVKKLHMGKESYKTAKNTFYQDVILPAIKQQTS